MFIFPRTAVSVLSFLTNTLANRKRVFRFDFRASDTF